MQIPRGYQLPPEYNESEYCLRLEKNIYGNKEGGRAWYLHLVSGLKKLGFERSNIDHCVFYRGNVIFLSYVDDCAVYAKDDSDIDQLFRDLKQAGFDVSDEGEIADFLGVAHTVDENGKIHLRQNKLIQQILADMGYNDRTKAKDKPAVVGQVLHRAEDEPPHTAPWGFRSIIGKLNFLLSTRPDLSFATHNAARFSHNPRECHTKAVQQICRYLYGTQNQGLIIDPTDEPLLEVYADAEFGGAWDKATARDDADTARSRIGYLIRYAGVPILWTSKLATEICLSVTEAEYISLSEALRSTIPMLQLLDECYERNLIPSPLATEVHCKVFEDNSGALELAKVPKMRPRTKHLNTKYHHFRGFVQDNPDKIKILPIASEDQLADALTKQPTQPLFLQFRKAIMGW